MAGRRLVDAVIVGVGLSAGRELYEKAKKALVDDEPEPVPETPEQKKAREKAEAQARKVALEAKERAARERAAKEAQTSREIESELAALKKRLAKKAP